IKLIENDWQGAIFAQAGLERVKLLPKDALALDWMLPAPAQGAVVVVGRGEDPVTKALAPLHNEDAGFCTGLEREFLRTLEGGCSAPIGALAQIKNQKVYFEGALFSLDGKQRIGVKREIELSKAKGLGTACAQEVLQKG